MTSDEDFSTAGRRRPVDAEAREIIEPLLGPEAQHGEEIVAAWETHEVLDGGAGWKNKLKLNALDEFCARAISGLFAERSRPLKAPNSKRQPPPLYPPDRVELPEPCVRIQLSATLYEKVRLEQRQTSTIAGLWRHQSTMAGLVCAVPYYLSVQLDIGDWMDAKLSTGRAVTWSVGCGAKDIFAQLDAAGALSCGPMGYRKLVCGSKIDIQGLTYYFPEHKWCSKQELEELQRIAVNDSEATTSKIDDILRVIYAEGKRQELFTKMERLDQEVLRLETRHELSSLQGAPDESLLVALGITYDEIHQTQRLADAYGNLLVASATPDDLDSQMRALEHRRLVLYRDVNREMQHRTGDYGHAIRAAGAAVAGLDQEIDELKNKISNRASTAAVDSASTCSEAQDLLP